MFGKFDCFKLFSKIGCAEKFFIFLPSIEFFVPINEISLINIEFGILISTTFTFCVESLYFLKIIRLESKFFNCFTLEKLISNKLLPVS
ncbi:Uncharacterised protein [Chlamydia trachomatis]|nr:Uncharacterised protein [Chlamydia trachomatis]